jgi:hypothetical protein
VNDRVDVAVLSRPRRARRARTICAADARAQLGRADPRRLDAHDRAVRRAAAEPVTYIAVGPIFGTRTKDTGYAPVGLDLVRAPRRLAPGADRRHRRHHARDAPSVLEPARPRGRDRRSAGHR